MFDNILKLLHPFIPFVTEYIYKNLKLLNKSDSIMIADFPKAFSISSYKNDFEAQEKIIEAIKQIRTAKTESKIPSNVKSEVYFANISGLGATASEIEKLSTIVLTDKKGEGKIIYTALGEFVLLDEKKDKTELIKELETEIKKVQFEVERSEKMLSNSRFVEKAPKELVETEKQKLANNKEMLESLIAKMDKIK